LDCLHASTWNAAKALEKESEIGTLDIGKKADLVFIEGNSLEDIMTLRNVMMTVQEGRIVYRK
jgi:imidazolonepropionase-like amidohydrolase